MAKEKYNAKERRQIIKELSVKFIDKKVTILKGKYRGKEGIVKDLILSENHPTRVGKVTGLLVTFDAYEEEADEYGLSDIKLKEEPKIKYQYPLDKGKPLGNMDIICFDLHEDGLDATLMKNGSEDFPAEIRDEVIAYQKLHDKLESYIDGYAKKNDIDQGD